MTDERRVAVVTGAASGIGTAIAEALAADGVRVVCVDLDGPGADDVAARIDGRGMTADVASAADCRALIDRVIDGEGRVDILVNNAGLQHVAPIHEMADERFEQLVRVMLFGPFYLTKAVIPSMLERGSGRIVNIASIHALVASPNKSAYVAAKHGLLGLTRTVALEVAARGITVNAICPAYVQTPLVERQLSALAATEGLSEAEVGERLLLANVPAGRFIEAGEVADAVRYLCSAAASGITGSTLTIDGGWTAR